MSGGATQRVIVCWMVYAYVLRWRRFPLYLIYIFPSLFRSSHLFCVSFLCGKFFNVPFWMRHIVAALVYHQSIATIIVSNDALYANYINTHQFTFCSCCNFGDFVCVWVCVCLVLVCIIIVCVLLKAIKIIRKPFLLRMSFCIIQILFEMLLFVICFWHLFFCTQTLTHTLAFSHTVNILKFMLKRSHLLSSFIFKNILLKSQTFIL